MPGLNLLDPFEADLGNHLKERVTMSEIGRSLRCDAEPAMSIILPTDSLARHVEQLQRIFREIIA